MKNLISLFLIIALLSSCGSKLYSYRKTVKVKDSVAKSEVKNATRIYMTIQEVKPSATAKMVKGGSNLKQLNVNKNTVYETSKPTPSAPQEKPVLAVSSSAMVR